MSISGVERRSPPASVLVVDDELGPREAIRMVLEPRFRVVTAESGEQALEVLRRERVDVVTLDWMMPGIGGDGIFEKLREMYSGLEIIVVSAAETLEELSPSSRDAPVRLSKPFAVAELLEAVGRAAEKVRAGRRREQSSRAPTVRSPRARQASRETEYDVAQMSQDIRNRLEVVVGFVRLLRRGDLDRWHAAEALDVIEGSVHDAVTLAVNFLHAEEAVSKTLGLRKTPVSLNRIVERAMKDDARRARLRRIEIQADLESDVPSVDVDAP